MASQFKSKGLQACIVAKFESLDMMCRGNIEVAEERKKEKKTVKTKNISKVERSANSAVIGEDILKHGSAEGE